MIKAKEISFNNVAFTLVLAIAASAALYVARPVTTVSKTAPIFYGEEVTVQKAEKAVKAGTAVMARTIVQAPQPVSMPLPLIPPVVTLKVLPQYPASALEQGEQGVVLLSVLVGLGGAPEKIDVKTSSGVAELDESAIKAVAGWKFSPATQGGTALASWFELPVRFELK